MRSKLRLIFLLRSAFFGPRFTARKDHQLVIHSATGTLCLDQNRCDGGSTQGILVGTGPLGLLNGQLGKISLVSWHSGLPLARSGSNTGGGQWRGCFLFCQVSVE